jgi:hypothetical protein
VTAGALLWTPRFTENGKKPIRIQSWRKACEFATNEQDFDKSVHWRGDGNIFVGLASRRRDEQRRSPRQRCFAAATTRETKTPNYCKESHAEQALEMSASTASNFNNEAGSNAHARALIPLQQSSPTPFGRTPDADFAKVPVDRADRAVHIKRQLY